MKSIVTRAGCLTLLLAAYLSFLPEVAISGSVVAWGDNYYGQTTVPVVAQSGVTAIAAGWVHSLALKDGTVIAGGYNYWGQTTLPAEAQSGVAAIAAGYEHSLALKDGKVLAWGRNDHGQSTVPAEAQSGVTAIAAGGYHCLALTLCNHKALPDLVFTTDRGEERTLGPMNGVILPSMDSDGNIDPWFRGEA